MSIVLTEEGKLDEAYDCLKQGLKLRLEEDSQIEPYNDFQLHHLYILQHFLNYDTSPEARELISKHKSYIKLAEDNESKVFSHRILAYIIKQ